MNKNRYFKLGVLSLVFAILISTVSINILENKFEKKVQSQLVDRASDWKIFIENYNKAIQDQDSGEDTFTLEKLKDIIAAQKIGETGYIWARTSEGHYEVSKDRLRDGENINDIQDADGNYIVRTNTEIALQAPDGGSFSEYWWQNPGEVAPRKKVAGLAYVEDLDWVIGVSAYYDDFQSKTLNQGLLLTLIFFVIFFLFGSLILGKKNSKNKK